MKLTFGEYSAFKAKGGLRYQKDNKLVAKSALPQEVVAFFENKFNIAQPATPQFAMPTEEEKARLREESLKVKPELQLTEEEQVQREVIPPVNPEEPIVPLDEEDFVEEATPVAQNTGVDPSFLESVSVHTAPIETLARALYDRFGIYTVYLGTFPQADEVNPLTGEQFTKYHLGIAYQAAVQAQSSGITEPEANRKAIDEGRQASANLQDSFQPVAYTMGEARRQNTFDYRTSVRGVQEQAQEVVQGSGAPSRMPKGEDEDEPILEPPIMGSRPIIRPNW